MVVRFDRRSLFVPYLAVGFWVVDGRGSRESVWPLRLQRGTHVLTVKQYIYLYVYIYIYIYIYSSPMTVMGCCSEKTF